jgi:hypothetical protein
MISFNSYAKLGETCFVDYYIEENIDPFEFIDHSHLEISIFKGDDIFEETQPYNSLLSFCNEGDILNLWITEDPETLNFYYGLADSLTNTSNAQMMSSIFISDYCDLKETVIINDSIFVCRLVKR